MLKNLPILFFSLAVLLQSCNEYKTTDSGVKYKLISDSAGTNAKNGDVVVVQLKYKNEVDSFDTYKSGRPVPLRIDSLHLGGPADALAYASKGDSLAVMVLNDSLYKNEFKDTAMAKKLKPGSYTTFYMKVQDVYTPERMKEEEAKYKKQQVERMKQGVSMGLANQNQMISELIDSNKAQYNKDETAIQNYVKKNKLDAKKTDHGVYVVYHNPGTGEEAAPGDSVKVTYIGKTLDGKVFDQSGPQNPYLEYILGVGQLIPGFDEGVAGLKEGGKITVIIPSPLAYGKEGRKKSPTEYAIQPNSVLMFDIELLDVKKWR